MKSEERSTVVARSNCACPCGASTFEVAGQPLLRFFCHCLICQDVYKAPFADVAAFRADCVTMPSGGTVNYKRYRLPPAVRRGTCRSCGAPVLGTMQVLPFLQVAFVPSRNVATQALLPTPAAHVFYHRRLADVPDPLPKYSGFWASELAVTRMLLMQGAAAGGSMLKSRSR